MTRRRRAVSAESAGEDTSSEETMPPRLERKPRMPLGEAAGSTTDDQHDGNKK
ncbi:hypothetical protein NHF46_15695 [Arthrobacter alpinus]|nr:hypothetical protein [Arthrobacter alpinus]